MWLRSLRSNGRPILFNPWRGCTKVSPGCANCYADDLSRRNPRQLGVWGPNGKRVAAAESYWAQPLKWNDRARERRLMYDRHPEIGEPDRRPRVFCASLADVFEDWPGEVHDVHGHRLMINRRGAFVPDGGLVPGDRPATLDDLRSRLFDLIGRTPELDWLLLTKRPENVEPALRRIRTDVHTWGTGNLTYWDLITTYGCPIENLWLGVSAEDQQRAAERVPRLLRVPAVVHFVSAEPLLGPLDLSPWLWSGHDRAGMDTQYFAPLPGTPAAEVWAEKVRWVIAGGESGPAARPVNPWWVRSLRNQCEAAGCAFFFKQWGEYGPTQVKSVRFVSVPSGVPMDEPAAMFRVGKKEAGRELDGREWSELPTPAEV